MKPSIKTEQNQLGESGPLERYQDVRGENFRFHGRTALLGVHSRESITKSV